MRLINEDDVLEIVERVTNDAIEKRQNKATIQQRLVNEIAALKPTGSARWISVDDRMPPYRQRVLVINETYNEENGYTQFNSGVTIRQPHLDFTYWGYRITHWMPLPEPPKEVKKNERN